MVVSALVVTGVFVRFGVMDTEQAQGAVQTLVATPGEGVGNERLKVMDSLLNGMSASGLEGEPEDAVEGGFASDLVELPDASVAGGVAVATAPDLNENALEDLGVEGVSEEEGDVGEGGLSKAKNFRGRWAHLSEAERRVVELATKRGLTLGEAYRAVFGEGGMGLPEENVGQVRMDAGEGGVESKAVAELEGRINEQRRRVDELKRLKCEAKGDLESYDRAAEVYLEAREGLRVLQGERQQALADEAVRVLDARGQAEDLAKAALGEEFPNALVPGTELYEACQEELAYLKAMRSPLLAEPHVQYTVARRMARSLGYHASANKRRGVEGGAMEGGVALSEGECTERDGEGKGLRVPLGGGVKGSFSNPRRTVRPVPVGGVVVESAATTMERRLAGANSSGAMLELMSEIGTPFEALLKQ